MEKDGGTVPGLAVGQEGHVAGLQVIAVELIELVPAGVLAEDEPPRVLRRVRGAPDRIGKKGQLRASPPWQPDLVQLHGLGEARADEQFALGGGPDPESCPPKIP